VLDKMYNSESLSLDEIYQNIMHFLDRKCVYAPYAPCVATPLLVCNILPSGIDCTDG